MQVRYLWTLMTIANGRSRTIVFPLPSGANWAGEDDDKPGLAGGPCEKRVAAIDACRMLDAIRGTALHLCGRALAILSPLSLFHLTQGS